VQILDATDARRRGLALIAHVRRSIQAVWPGADLPAEAVGLSASMLAYSAATLLRLVGTPRRDWERLTARAWDAAVDPEAPPSRSDA